MDNAKDTIIDEDMKFRNVFISQNEAVMLEKYLNDKEAEAWLINLEERGTIISRHDYKRYRGGSSQLK